MLVSLQSAGLLESAGSLFRWAKAERPRLKISLKISLKDPFYLLILFATSIPLCSAPSM